MSSQDAAPSEPDTPGTPTPTPNPSVLPQVSPRKPPRFPPETPRTVRVQAYPEDLRELQAWIRRYGETHDVPAAGRKGGRPPVAAEAFRALLRTAQLLPTGARASVRIRKADAAARIGFARLYRRTGFAKALPYSAIEPVVAAASGADRPLRRWTATVGFCQRRILAPFQPGAERLRPADALQEILPTVVPELAYGFGPVVYQSTLGDYLEGRT